MRNFPAVISLELEKNKFLKSFDSDVVGLSETKPPSKIINKQRERQREKEGKEEKKLFI